MGFRKDYNRPMSDAIANIPPEFKGLSKEERISRVQQLWDFIAESPDEIPVTDIHKGVLDKRLSSYEEDQAGESTWGEVRDQILKDLRKA